MRPAKVRMQALPPLDPADFIGEDGHILMRKQVKEMMAQKIRELRAGG
jgi:1-acyl-sn-glycerol-3-phosphate acyltransferase